MAPLRERARRAAPGVEHRLDGRAVERMQREQGAGAVALAPQRRRVDDEQVFEDHPQPGAPVMRAVRAVRRIFRPSRSARVGVAPGFGADGPVHPLDLVLARLDDEAQQIIGVGQRAQIGEGESAHSRGRA